MDNNSFSLFEISSENQIDDFIDWLEEQENFPLTVYINGVCMTFPNRNWKDCFQVGFSTARSIMEELEENKWKLE